MPGTHLYHTERSRIKELKRQNFSIREIAKITGRSIDTIKKLTKGLEPKNTRKADYDKVMTLHFDFGLTQAEIARMLGVEPSTVHVILKRYGPNSRHRKQPKGAMESLANESG